MNQKIETEPKKFIRKMYEILKDQRYENIVSWDDRGTSILIKNSHKFYNEVILHNFKLKKMSSFIRQLHLYDFHKVKSNGTLLVFKHQIFKKGNQSLLKNIGRKRMTKAKQLEQDISNRITTLQELSKEPSIKQQKKDETPQKENQQICNSIVDLFELQFNSVNCPFSHSIFSELNIAHLQM